MRVKRLKRLDLEELITLAYSALGEIAKRSIDDDESLLAQAAVSVTFGLASIA